MRFLVENHPREAIPRLSQKYVHVSVTYVNPLRHTIEADSAGPAMSAPSTANARLQVTGSSCHLAGSLPASRQCSDRPGFDGLDFAGHGFFMTDDVAEELLVSAEVIAGFRWARV